MLTRKQMELLEFIRKRVSEEGVPPSFDEMKEAMDLRSKSGIHRLITALEERGFIRRLAHRARAIDIVKLPEVMERTKTAKANAAKTGFTPRVIEGDKPQTQDLSHIHALELPVMGRIAAGVPIEAIQEVSHHIAVPGSMLSGKGRHYALEVRGDSMVEAGINDGDVVVIREQTTAENGDIVVALIEDQEATLKYFRRQDSATVLLEAANPAYAPRLVPAHQIKVQGRLVGLIRSY